MTNLAQLQSLPGFHDPVSSMSHLLGAVFFFFLGVFLVLSAVFTLSAIFG